MAQTRRIILEQGQSPGDILTASRAVYDFCRAYPEYEIDIHSPCPSLFAGNPYTTRLDENAPDVEVYALEYNALHESGMTGSHYSEAFRTDIMEKVNTSENVEKWGKVIIPKTGLWPEIYLTEEELGWYHQVHCEFYWDGPYWIINAGMKSDNELKMYHRWQEVVDILNEGFQGKVRLIQIGSKSGSGLEHIHKPLDGVWNLVGKTNIRELLRLAYWSAGIIGPISFQFVIGAAQFKLPNDSILKEHIPNVVVAGGKEGMRWHVYNHVRWINKNGCLPCAVADGCWLGGAKGKCKNLVKPEDMDEPVPLCFEITRPEEIAEAVFAHYNGGRLELPETAMWHVPEGMTMTEVEKKYEQQYRKEQD